MKIETIKSVILVILVAFSLLLTLGLWNYQPKYEYLNDPNLYEADIGGQAQAKKDIVKPSLMVFHDYQHYYGFRNPKDMEALYRKMHDWVLYNFKVSEAKSLRNDSRRIELTFPNAIPMSAVPELFSFNEDQFMPDWSFKRILISFNKDNTSLNVQFPSAKQDKVASATVNNPRIYKALWNRLVTQADLTEFISFDKASEPIYIPKQAKEMTQQAVTINTIQPNKLVRAIFPDMSIVTRNISSTGEKYFSDGQRGMRIKQHGHLIRFTNPVNTNYQVLTPENLLDLSMHNINEYKGWLGNYRLEKIQPSSNYIRYRMTYGGYPVFNHNNLAMIEQEWRNGTLYQYNRPLISLNTIPGGETTTLASGDVVVDYLIHSKYDLKQITDIEVGFQMVDDSDKPYYVTLKPVWYICYGDNWIALDIAGKSKNKGGH